MCVICGGRIESGRRTASNGFAFECATHGLYIISEAAAPDLLSLALWRREAALEKAKMFAPCQTNDIVIRPSHLS